MPLHFINPNYHVILIHYPLGVFVLGVFLELFSLLWRKGSVRIAALWMIMLGAFLSLPAVTSGIYALHEVAINQGISGERYHLLRYHVWFQSGASLLAVLCCVVGLGASDKMREKLRAPLLLGVMIACGGMVFGSWTGGETIYQHGTAVLLIDDHGKIQEVKPLDPDATRYEKIVDYYIGGEKQMHIIVAGFTLSAIVGALGLSIRRLTTHRAEEAQLEAEGFAGRRSPRGEPRRVTDDLSVVRSLNPEAEVEADFAHVPAGRWWLVAALIALVTGVLGYWTLSTSQFADIHGWHHFVGHLKLEEAKKWKVNRHLAHLALGGAMILLALILGCIARWAPRRRGLLTFFAALLILVVAAQVWIGIALTFDGEGPLTRFSKPTDVISDDSATTPSAAPQDSAPATTQASPDTAPVNPPTDSTKAPA